MRNIYHQYYACLNPENMSFVSERADTKGEELMWLYQRYKKNMQTVSKNEANLLLRRDMKHTLFFINVYDNETIFKEFETLNCV